MDFVSFFHSISNPPCFQCMLNNGTFMSLYVHARNVLNIYFVIYTSIYTSIYRLQIVSINYWTKKKSLSVVYKISYLNIKDPITKQNKSIKKKDFYFFDISIINIWQINKKKGGRTPKRYSYFPLKYNLLSLIGKKWKMKNDIYYTFTILP